MKKLFITAVLSCISLGLTDVYSANFYLSPQGNDSNPGTKEKPFATLQKAQEAVRAARTASPRDAITITLAGGFYPLSQTLLFDTRDSGFSGGAPVRYVAAQGEEVIVSGGRRLTTEWVRDDNLPGVWKTRLPDEGIHPFEQLWVNGRRAIRARTPDYWHYARLDNVSEERQKTPSGEEKIIHTFKIADHIMKTLHGITPEELNSAQIHVFHKWDTTREWLQNIDADKNFIYTQGKPMQGHNKMVRGCLYYLENYKEALTSPGEWFLSKDGWLYYYPYPDEDIQKAEVIYPQLNRLIQIQGKENHQYVRNIEFEGIKFRYSEYNIPAGGVPPMQAAMACQEETILINNARDIFFLNCAVEHTGNVGIWFKENCRNCTVDTTRLYDLGASAIRIGETQIKPEQTRTSSITINNCILQSGGRIHPSAVGIWIGQSPNNRITNNEISDFLYTGVSIGWTWGYTESAAQHNLVAYNHIHHIGYRILSDMGGIYTLGNQVGSILRGNVIHDIYSSSYGGWGLYPDEGTTGLLLDDNLVYNTKDGGFHQHYGRENIVRNNIFAFSQEGQIAVTRKEEHTSFIFEKNIVIYDTGTLLGYGGWAAGANVVIDHNLYWNAAGQPVTFIGKTLEEWQAMGHDKHSLIADPLFEDAAKRDFRLKKGSPAFDIGFIPFDTSKAGVQGNPEWIALAQSIPMPDFAVTEEIPPFTMNEDFESSLSFFNNNVNFQHENHPELISLTDQTAASGKHSLMFTDSPDLEHSYNPHLYFDPNYLQGTLRMSYKIKLGANTITHNEIRSEGNPYLIGPSIYFNHNVLQINKQKLMELPLDQWLEIQITAPLGDKANGTWNLKVILPDGSSQEFTALACDPKWNRARWIGFCALGQNSSVFYLDDLRVDLLPEEISAPSK